MRERARTAVLAFALAGFALGGVAGTGLAACSADAKSSRGFRLPDGDAGAGRRAFVELRCYDCHSVPGVEAPAGATPVRDVPLGGDVTRVRTYGELVTAIINPSHKVVARATRVPPGPEPPSPMALARLDEQMTVQQLVDLVAFLQGTYRVVPPSFDPYVYVYP